MFTDDVIKKAWDRAQGQCECQSRSHSHFYTPCAKPLVWENRGKKVWGGWEIKQINENAAETLENSQVVCMTCYEKNY